MKTGYYADIKGCSGKKSYTKVHYVLYNGERLCGCGVGSDMTLVGINTRKANCKNCIRIHDSKKRKTTFKMLKNCKYKKPDTFVWQFRCKHKKGPQYCWAGECPRITKEERSSHFSYLPSSNW